MKYLLVLTLFLLTACGGGGGSSPQPDPQPDPDPVFNMPLFFNYEVQQVGQPQKYQGRGVRDGDSIYLYPDILSSGGYTVTGRVDYILSEGNNLIADLRLFGFIGSMKIREAYDIDLIKDGSTWLSTFSMNGAEFDMRISSVTRGDINDPSLINADWNEIESSFDSEEVLFLENDSGHVYGYSSSGCNINGETLKNQNNSVFSISLTLSGCSFEGSYIGAYYVYETAAGIKRLSGAISNNDSGFRLFVDLVQPR